MKQRKRLAVLCLVLFILTVYVALKRRLQAAPLTDVMVEARAPSTPVPSSKNIRDPPTPTLNSETRKAPGKSAEDNRKDGEKEGGLDSGKDAQKDNVRSSNDTAKKDATNIHKDIRKDTDKENANRNNTPNDTDKKSADKPARGSTKTKATSSASDDLVRTAVEVNATTGLVLFTMVNNAYVDFTLSWLCNTANMGQVHQHVMLVATDNKTAQHLRSTWPNVHVVTVNATQFSGAQVYSHAGYVRLMIERSRYIHRMLQAGVRLLLFEVDCVWLSNPLPLLLGDRYRDSDMVATVVGNRTAGGFLLLKPTARTLAVWGRLMERLDGLWDKLSKESAGYIVSWTLNDQEFLAGLVKQRFAGIRVDHLPVSSFPDGKWYQLSAKQRQERPVPVLINNNFIKGNDAKRRRAKANGHWFLKGGGKNMQCDVTAIQAVVTTNETQTQRV